MRNAKLPLLLLAGLLLAPAAASAQAADAAAGAPTLSLAEVLDEVRRQNPDLAAARARLLAASQTSNRAWAGYLPNVTAAGSWTRNSTGAALMFPDFAAGFVPGTDPEGNPTLVPASLIEIEVQSESQLGAQVSVSQPILALPLIPAILNAYDAEKVAELSVDQVRREIVFGAGQAYYGAVGLREAVRLTENQLELLREHLRSARAAFDAGTVPELTVLRAGIEVSRAEQDLTRAQNAYQNGLGTLAVLMGRQEIDFEVAPMRLAAEDGELPPLEAAVDQALGARPDLQAADLQLTIQERQKKGALAQFLPVIGANWTWRWSDVAGFTGENDTWSLMLTASWTLLDGGLRIAQVREAEAGIREARANLASSRNQITQEVRQARLDIESARANLLKAGEQVRLARANWRAVERAFEVGAASALEVADASNALRAAEMAEVTEAVRLKVAGLALQKAVGAPRPMLAGPAAP